MSNRVTIVFEDNEYRVQFNETLISKGTDFESAMEAFKNEIKNNSAMGGSEWEKNESQIRALEVAGVDINSEYKTMSLGDMKYFHHTEKVFYMGNGEMIQLVGGFEFFLAVLKLVKEGLIKDGNALAEFCRAIVEKNANYSLNEEAISVISAAFSYGMVSYQFSNGKMNKGTANEKCTFEVFTNLVLNTI